MKKIILTSLVGLCVTTQILSAAPTDLYVGGYGGSFQKTLIKLVFPKFEKENNVKIHYSAGTSTATLAKLLAQEKNPDLDFVFIDSGPMAQAVNRNLCQPVDDIIAKTPLYSNANFAGGKAVGFEVVATGLTYNKDYFKKMGWSAPTSWLDLTNEKYKGKLGFQPITNGYGLLTLMALNDIEGGPQDNVDKGMALVKKTIKHLVNNYEGSSAKLSEQFQSGEVVLAPWGSGRAYKLKQTGFNVGFVYPKEKAITLLSAVCVVKNNNSTKLSRKLMEYILSPKIQTILSNNDASGPVNKTVKVDQGMKDFMPVGENAKKMRSFDWDVINQHRESWTRAWVRQIEN